MKITSLPDGAVRLDPVNKVDEQLLEAMAKSAERADWNITWSVDSLKEENERLKNRIFEVRKGYETLLLAIFDVAQGTKENAEPLETSLAGRAVKQLRYDYDRLKTENEQLDHQIREQSATLGSIKEFALHPADQYYRDDLKKSAAGLAVIELRDQLSDLKKENKQLRCENEILRHHFKDLYQCLDANKLDTE
jgi:cell division protein FtsB